MSESNVVCPNCGAVLPVAGLAPGVLVQCSRCNKQFNLGSTVPIETKTSGKAVASLILGLVPVPLITGIPAIVLGIWALLDIRRYGDRLRGSGIATTGIIFGSLCTFVCTPVVLTAAWYISNAVAQMNFTDDPVEVASIAAKIAEFELPDGLEAIGGASAFGFETAVYGDQENSPSSMILLMKFPGWLAANQEQMQLQMQQQMQVQQRQTVDIQESRTVSYEIQGKQVDVTVGIGTDPQSGKKARQYLAMIPTDSGPIMVLVMTEEVPEGETDESEMEDPPVRLTEEQVKKFLESIR